MEYTKRVPHAVRGAPSRRSLSNTGLASRSTIPDPGCSTSEALTAVMSSASTGGDGSGFQQSTAEKPDGGALGPLAAHRAAIASFEPADGGGGLRSSSE